MRMACTTRKLALRQLLPKPLIGIPVLMALLSGCTMSSSQEAIPAAPTLPPVWTASPSPQPPTAAPSSTPTQRPSPTPSCDLQEAIHLVKETVQYEENAVHFLDIAGTASLAVWYVDPELTPRPSAEVLAAQLEQAKLRAVEVAARANAASPCVSQLFDVINPIVVDSQYQGWFSGQLAPRYIPSPDDLSSEELASAAGSFRVGYERTSLGHSFSGGNCRWPEARDRLQSHFSSERELVSFYFVVDDLGAHVWVQWDGPADMIMMTVNLGNVFLALDCFSPEAEIIFIIVDEGGVAQLMGVVPNDDTANLRIVYP